MKTFLFNALIYYVLLSIIGGLFYLFIGAGGFITLRIIISLVLAYYKPLKLYW